MRLSHEVVDLLVQRTDKSKQKTKFQNVTISLCIFTCKAYIVAATPRIRFSLMHRVGVFD